MKLVEIDLNLIDEDLDQPRKHFDKASIEELAESIREVGLLNPIKVVKAKYGRYKIIFGNRRYKALKLLGFRKIPCILSDNNDDLDIYFEQLTENIQRKDFTPIEEALGYEKLLGGDNGWQVSKKYLSSKLGKTEKYITNKLSLLVFGEEVRKIIHGGTEILPGRLSEEQALSLKDVPLEYRDQLALKVAKDQRGIRDIKRIAQLFINPELSGQLKEKFLKMPCHELVALSVDKERCQELEQAAAAKVRPAPEAAATITAAEETTVEEPAAESAAEVAPSLATPSAETVPSAALRPLLPEIPPYQLPPEIAAAAPVLSKEKRRQLLSEVDTALAAFENHIRQLTELKAQLSEKNNA